MRQPLKITVKCACFYLIPCSGCGSLFLGSIMCFYHATHYMSHNFIDKTYSKVKTEKQLGQCFLTGVRFLDLTCVYLCMYVVVCILCSLKLHFVVCQLLRK